MRYAVVIEKAEGNYSAYVPDLPGCVATGDTVEDVDPFTYRRLNGGRFADSSAHQHCRVYRDLASRAPRTPCLFVPRGRPATFALLRPADPWLGIRRRSFS